MGGTVCAKCGTGDFVTINTPNSVNVNTVDSGKKVIIITEGEEATGDAGKITVCSKCGDVIIGK